MAQATGGRSARAQSPGHLQILRQVFERGGEGGLRVIVDARVELGQSKLEPEPAALAELPDRGERRQHAARRLGLAGADLVERQLVEQRGVGPSAHGEELAEVARRRARGTARRRTRCGLTQDLGGVQVRPAPARQQVRGHALGIGAGVAHEPRGAPVTACTHRGLDARVDGGAHDRVREGQSVSLLDQARGRQSVERIIRCRALQPGDRGELVSASAVAHECERLRQLTGTVGQGVKPLEHRAGERLRAQLGQVGRGGVVGFDAALAGPGEQRAHEQRRAAGGVAAGLAERLGGLGVQLRTNERGHCLRAERLELQAGGQRMRGQPPDQLALWPLLARARGRNDRHRQLVDPLGQVEQETQRRHIAPMGVVHSHQDGRPLGQVGGQPVQPVKPREVALVGISRLVEQRPGERRGSGERRPVAAADERLEHLERRTESEVGLELRAACAGHRHPGRGSLLQPLGEQPRLPDARATLDHHASTGALARGR